MVEIVRGMKKESGKIIEKRDHEMDYVCMY